MALSILFWVRKSAANSKGFASLKVRLTLPNNDIENFSSGLVVDVKLWNPVKKRVSGNSSEASRVNLYITKSEAKLIDIYDDLNRDERDISSEIIKNIFLGKAQQRLTILGAISLHNISYREQMEITGEGTESTVEKFELLALKLTKFMEFKYSRKDYFISELNHGFVTDFRNWLLMYGSKTSGPLAPDSATGTLKKMKKITLNLFKRSLMKHDPFIDTKLKWEDASGESLNETELKKFEDLRVTIPRLQKVKDRFIVSCYSGLSHGDMSKCTRDDLVKNFASEETWIKVWRQKTGVFCKIPVLPPVQEIIDKYWYDEKCIAGNKLFPSVALQSMNEYLKQLGDLAGIEKSLSSHCGRHSFAQMALDYGVDIETIAEILGHKSSKTTKSTYLKMSHIRVSSEMKAFTDKRFPVMKIAEEDKKIG